ncbi:hypothetical protein L228DRAFT_257439 [Xylona heveae TC161]|uniref:DUF1771-domain-containing protein n=1 Tax=Xylona heveae (strain CBS 132557 / TC161) TaxID=1328760 RepID=A0A165J9B6_XYLHT|nr:hypothetical protein L228DRAFT_257439 [Xylona heveae TC161]KZF25925.1 hypothetical protein L228DRAFT_257439 [Xylona heveae TC161]
MVSDSLYEQCLPILRDSALEDEDKTEKLEELLRKQTPLTGPLLENTILDVLWRFRDSSTPSASPPVRHTVVRRASPAPWQIPRATTPRASSPLAVSATLAGTSPLFPPGLGIPPPPGLSRTRSSNMSPFTSPRPSPRLAFSTPSIPHSPNLNTYEFSEPAITPDIYGDYGSDTVDWLVNDDAMSNASSAGGYTGESTLNGGAATWIQPTQTNMSPYDMLRSVLGDGKTDEEIEQALEANGYDFTATVMSLMEEQQARPQSESNSQFDNAVVVGKSMSPGQRPATPSNNNHHNHHQGGRNGVVCRFWLSTGTCLRADCRFSHDLSSHICKYWVMGNCLAGDTCVFSHDPANLVNRLALDDHGSTSSSPSLHGSQSNVSLQDHSAFPALRSKGSDQWSTGYTPGSSPGHYVSGHAMHPPPGLRRPPGLGDSPYLSSHSRPSSRPQSRQSASVPAVDDTEAFPTLGSASMKGSKKHHHGKRGSHGHSHHDSRENVPSSLADIVRMTPSPGPAQNRRQNRSGKGGGANASRENSAAALAIPPPQHVPWLETGAGANQAYLKIRQEAIKHGGLRNKYLQSAAQAWNRNDARAAKALSLRGQSENDLMRKAHREAARQLYEERNKNANSGGELYVDLHGLHPDEAIEYLERVLLEQASSPTPIYAITGTGHHSKNGKDKIGKAVRIFLNEWRYAYREFSVPGDRNNVGGILGIDPQSYDKSLLNNNNHNNKPDTHSTSDTTTTTSASNNRNPHKSSSPSSSTTATATARSAAAAVPNTAHDDDAEDVATIPSRPTALLDIAKVTTKSTSTSTSSSAGGAPSTRKRSSPTAGGGGGGGGSAAVAAAAPSSGKS